MVDIRVCVGHTYQRLSETQAKLDRTGQYRKVHDWILYVDVANHIEYIDRVSFHFGNSFHPSTFHCTCPVKNNTNNLWRFATRQQTYAIDGFPITIQIRGTGGTVQTIVHDYSIQPYNNEDNVIFTTFTENRTIRPLKYLKMNTEQQFGIELELTSANHISPETLAQQVQDETNIRVVVYSNYRDGRNDTSYTNWKIVPDSSIICSSNQPNCNTMELVSPILQGGTGLSEINKILRALDRSNMQINKSMGFHVHIDVSDLSIGQLIKVCQNFIKYEHVMDTFMPPSRRTGSPEADRYFQSNRASVDYMASSTSRSKNKQLNDTLSTCPKSYDALVNLMNRNGRYYKLNLQNLKSGRQDTIEFRQHSGTMDYNKINAWIRFCIAFVQNSAKLQSPKPFLPNRDIDYQFNALFQYVIKDRALQEYYNNRRMNFNNDDDNNNNAIIDVARRRHPCCQNCAEGRTCSASTNNNRNVQYSFTGIQLNY